MPLRRTPLWRHGGLGSREGDPPAVSKLVGICEAVVVGLLLALVFIPASARASKAPPPDAAPQGASTSTPSPDAAPHAASRSASSPGPATVPPSEGSRGATSSGSEAAASGTLGQGSARAGSSSPIATTPSATPTSKLSPASSRRRAPPARRGHHGRSTAKPRPAANQFRLLIGRRQESSLEAASTIGHAVVRPGGVLLLLSALALGVLVVASIALLRLLRLNGDWWEGRTP